MHIVDNSHKTDYADILNMLMQVSELQPNSTKIGLNSFLNFETIWLAKYEYFCLRHSATLFDIFCSYRPSYSRKKIDTYFDFYGFSPFNETDDYLTSFAYEIMSTNSYYINVTSPWSFFFKLDIFAYFIEIFSILFIVLFVFSKIKFKGTNALNLYQLAINSALSYYEVIGVLTSAFLLIIFDLVSASIDEDIADMALLLVLFFVIGSIVGFSYGLGIIKAYTSISPVSNGESTKRIYLSDVVNVFLCLLRVFLCWTRYIFYDLQVEHVDMALQYTDEIGLVFDNEAKGLYLVFLMFLSCVLDLLFLGIQILMCLFKFGIAVFLLWLILDLFLLRIAARVSEKWLINSIIKSCKKILF